MSQPVKLSDDLVLDARLAGDLMQRSIAGQVEFWARIGRSVEMLLDGQKVLEFAQSATARPVSECLKSVDSPAGQKRVSSYLAAGPYPHYEKHPDLTGMLVRTEENGQKTTGRFVNRQFQSATTKRKR